MSVTARISPISRLLIVVCLMLAAIVTLELQMVRSGAFITAIEPSALDFAGENQVSGGQVTGGAARVRLSPMSSFQAVNERPLFVNTRQPLPEPAAKDTSVRAAQLLARWKLTGIVVAGEESFAHVRGVRDKVTQKLQKGASLDGWRVAEISAGQIVLEQGAESATMELYEPDSR